VATALMAAAVLLENRGDNKAIRAIQAEFWGQLFEKIGSVEILPRLQTFLDLQLLRNPEIHRELDLVVVERLQTVIVTASNVFP
jgi:hypothetical protein